MKITINNSSKKKTGNAHKNHTKQNDFKLLLFLLPHNEKIMFYEIRYIHVCPRLDRKKNKLVMKQKVKFTSIFNSSSNKILKYCCDIRIKKVCVHLIADCEASPRERPREVFFELFLSYENGKDIKVALHFAKSLFFGYIAKFCILQALVPILAIGVVKKMQFLVIFDFHLRMLYSLFNIVFCFFGFSKVRKSSFTP
jgi:hypothetical protein